MEMLNESETEHTWCLIFIKSLTIGWFKQRFPWWGDMFN